MTQAKRPEIGATVVANGIKTNYLEDGTGSPVVFIHGSGPGVTAYANWRLVMPGLAPRFRTLAPDLAGFGYTDRRAGTTYNIQVWADQVIGFLDALDIPSASLVGNSFGGAIALRVVTQHPDRVDKLVLMGSMGVPFPITEGLDRVWGYQPSVENMRQLLGIFAYSPELANDEQLARVRYEASTQPGFQEAFSSMFPPPRQNSVDAMIIPDDELRNIGKQTLIVHGRDDKVIPLENSLRLLQLINRSQLHVFGRCGHWTQIERAGDFTRLVDDFLSRSGEQTGTVTTLRLPAASPGGTQGGTAPCPPRRREPAEAAADRAARPPPPKDSRSTRTCTSRCSARWR
jgi:2-hydroxy-6-oxo-octa-2,4-dienoate hydrolase